MSLDIEPFRRGKLALSELRKDLRKITWNYLSIVRNRESGQKALSEIDYVAAAVGRANVQSIQDNNRTKLEFRSVSD